MSYYIIIRGPLGCGKTTLAKNLTKKLNAKYFSVDEILDKHKLTKDWEQGYISEKSFLKVNEIITPNAKTILKSRRIVIFDGNFYRKSQIDDLINKLDYPHYVFTLKAPLEVCIKRDSERKNPHGKDAATVVYKKSTEMDYGIIINTENKTAEEVVAEIIFALPKFKKR